MVVTTAPPALVLLALQVVVREELGIPGTLNTQMVAMEVRVVTEAPGRPAAMEVLVGTAL